MPQDYPHSVAATIEISFKRLSPRVQDLHGLLAHLDAGSIPRCIIERQLVDTLHSTIETGIPLHAETTQYADALTRILLPHGDWSTLDFDDLIGECERYSLIQRSTQNGERFYSMHVLVQDFLRATCGVVRGYPSSRLVTRLLGSAITIGPRYELAGFNRLLSSHLRLINLDDVTKTSNHYGFGIVFNELDEAQLAVSHLERCLEIWRESLDEDSEVILDTMELLAHLYSISGREESTLKLRDEETQKTTW
ncbi:hypothetical protein CPB86DRAFT_814030 [Serendipita vermifera]|nr:hypothetical protein CPB86DRAFT_814030 [Serendipita vermifera]